MQPKVNYTLVGVFVVVLGIALLSLIFWLTAGVSTKKYKTYLAYMNESVSGLNEKSPVKYNGVQVGVVDNISLNPNDPSNVRLILNIEEDVPIREDVTATIETQGLTGISYLGLRGGAPSSPLLQVQPGQEYPVIQTRPSLLFRLDTALRKLTTNLDQITSGVKSIFDKQNQQSIKESLLHIELVTAQFAKNSKQIDASLKNLDIVLQNTKKASVKFPQLVTDISTTMRAGRVTLNNLDDQLSPQLYTTLQDVSDLARQLKSLSSQLENNPSMLIRGKQPGPPGPGE